MSFATLLKVEILNLERKEKFFVYDYCILILIQIIKFINKYQESYI